MKKRKQSSVDQNVLILTAGSDVELCRLEANNLYMASPDTDPPQAWERDFSQQAKDEKSGEFLQVVSVLSKTPVRIFRNRPALAGKSTDLISSGKEDEELTYMDARSAKNSMLLWIGIITALLAVTVGIIVLVNMKQTSTAVALSLTLAGTALIPWKKQAAVIKQPDDLKELFTKDLDTVLCMIIDAESITYGFRRVMWDLIPEDSRERSLNGEPFFIIGLDDIGLYAIEPANEIRENDSPQDLFLALECEGEINALYGQSGSIVEKIKLTIFFILCFALIVVLFLISVVAMGG